MRLESVPRINRTAGVSCLEPLTAPGGGERVPPGHADACVPSVEASIVVREAADFAPLLERLERLGKLTPGEFDRERPVHRVSIGRAVAAPVGGRTSEDLERMADGLGGGTVRALVSVNQAPRPLAPGRLSGACSPLNGCTPRNVLICR